MPIEVYSRARDGSRALSADFCVKEFACHDGSDPVFVDSALVDTLQTIRDHFGQPVHITSGYRTARHNSAVGGTAYSQHLYGRAADIQIDGVDAASVAAYAETLLPNTGGIGLYAPNAARVKGWVHLDVRPVKARWKG